MGLFHRTLPELKVQRAHSWKKTRLRTVNCKDCLTPRKCLGSSSWGQEQCAENITVSLSALTAFLHQLLSAAVKKTAPRAVTSVLVQLCCCHMASLWHCSSNEIKAIVVQVQGSRRSWKRSLALGDSRSVRLAEERG